MATDKENFTPITPKYLEAFQNFIENRKETITPMSPKYVESFRNFNEKRSTSSSKTDSEITQQNEKMSFCKRKLDFKKEVEHSQFVERKWTQQIQSKDKENISQDNQINVDIETQDDQIKVDIGKEKLKSISIARSVNQAKNTKPQKNSKGKKLKEMAKLKKKIKHSLHQNKLLKPPKNIKKSNEKEQTEKIVIKNKPASYDIESESESEEEVKAQKKLLTKLDNYFKNKDIQLEPRSSTRGDGNCFFRSIVDQINLHEIPDKPKTHRELRLAVCNHIKNLPPAILRNTVDIVFKGKRQGLTGLASRQRKLGQFVDDNGVMVMATALFLRRHIQVYSENALYESTKIDGGEGADQHPSLTIFYFRDYQHYQSVVRCTC